MIFEPNAEQNEIIKAAGEFAKGEFDPDKSIEMDHNCEFPGKIYKKACSLGFVGIHFPEIFSGQGMGLIDYTLMAEALCCQDSTMGSALALSTYGSECILRFGDDGLKNRILPKILKGKMLCGGGFTDLELDAGSIPVAEKDGDKWILNGKQSAVINAGTAGVYCLLCKTMEKGDTRESISMVIIEKEREGVSVSSGPPTMGLRAVNITDLEFDNVMIPSENFVSNFGNGEHQAALFMNESRIQFAAIGLGIAQGAFAHALQYTKQREQFGLKLAKFQVLRHRLADMAVNIRKARLLTYQAAMNFDRGVIDFSLSAAAKLTACRTAVEVSFQAIQLLGGYGYMSEYHVERYYRDAKMLEICGGTPDHLKDIISDVTICKI